jgi:hypothetical protein
LLGAIALVLIAGIGAAVALTQSAKTSPEPAGSHCLVCNPGLTFGMTKKQVRQLSGAPAAIEGRCWLFHPKEGKVGSITLTAKKFLTPKSNGALRLCFNGGLFSDAQHRVFYAGHWTWYGWTPNLMLVTGTIVTP